MRYTKSALGLLNAQYRSVLKKCFLINMGLFALSAPALADDFSLNAADLTTVKDSAVAINWIERPSPAGNVNDHVITVEVSPTKTQYFEYDYPTSGPTTTHQNYSGKSDETITDSYVDISEGTTGGAIVIGNADNVTFNADFVKNSSAAGLGGAVDVISTGENGVNFKGNFIANSATGSGGAIFNEENGKIGEIEGDFIANHADITDSRLSIYAGGGAIDNDGSIGKISGNFINNYVQSTRLADDPIKIDAQGGAIVGWTTDITKSGIDIIQASFIRNKVLSENGVAAGGAIASATIGNVNKQGALLDGDFSYNQAISTNEIAQGGAIYNSNISEILGYFKGNQAISNAGQAYGGAIYYSTIGKITDDGKVLGGIEGNFENNLAHANRSAFGGAIHNGTISKIIGNFIKNQAISTGDAAGGAIYVSYIGRITDDGNVLGGIEGNFENNQAQGGINTEGGAIYDSNISKIIGDFTGNQAVSEGEKADGGAISTSVIGKITNDGKVLGGIEGSFKNNLAESKSAYTSESSGGAINLGIISKIVGDFDSNVVKATNRAAGGAISNATIGEIIGNLNKNQAIITGYGVNSNSTVLGGAIYNSTIGKILDDGTVVGGINGNFENNSIDAVNDASGGAIDNSTISQITGNFVGNIASVRDNEVLGGAIHKSTIGKITDDGKVLGGINGNFENNEAQVQVGGTASASGGAISEGTISQITGNFSGNKAVAGDGTASGGAINSATIGKILDDGTLAGGINSNFENNSAQGNEAFGGAIYGGTISQITGNFNGNQTVSSSAYSDGGAIYGGTISHIIGNFTGNKAISQTDDSHGGAIANSKIGSITNDGKVLGGIEGIFENNVSQAEAYAWGGAIDNSNISQITGDFVGNQAVSLGQGFDSHGGAITDSIIGKITDDGTALGGINGNFNNNIAQGTEIAFGGAIYNSTISQITGDFTENKAVTADGTAQGGAIYDGKIDLVKGKFTGNQAISSNGESQGGAIANIEIGKISSEGMLLGGIEGDFKNNSSKGKNAAYGGAIDDSTISKVVGNFVENEVISIDDYAQGGAIANSTINSITGNFTNNNASSENGNALGGVLYYVNIEKITGDFTNNYASSENGYAEGGAIANTDERSISDLTGNFSGNYVKAKTDALGGAIYNTDDSSIGSLTGNFIGNYALAVSGESSSETITAYGGAVYNDATIKNIKGDFINNYAKREGNETEVEADADTDASGGAIYNIGTIETIEGNFSGNHTEGQRAYGGAIQTSKAGKGAVARIDGIIKSITGNFTNNYANGISTAAGGAIVSGKINEITGNFIRNHVVASEGNAYGGAIGGITIGEIAEDGTLSGGLTGNFENNSAQGAIGAYGGAITAENNISSLTGNFNDNSAVSDGLAQGGAVNNMSHIGNISGNFTNNFVSAKTSPAQGGAIFNQSKIDSISGNFTNNHASSAEFASYGGAILNTGEIGKISNAVFSGNYVEGVTNEAGAVTDGGAVWNAGKITFEGNNVFKDNYKIVDGNKEANDIYNAGAIYVAENGSLDISGGISGNKDAPSSVINIGEGGLLQIHDATVSDNTIYMNADSTLALDVTNFGGSSDEQTGGKIDGNIVLNADSTLKVSTYNVFGEDEGESTYQFATNVDTNNGEWKLNTKVENLLYNYDGPVLNDENNTLMLKYKKKTAEEVADAFGTDMEMSEEILAWSSPKADDNNQFNRISDEINRRAQQGDKSLVNDMSDLHENTQGNLDVARYFGDLVSKNVTEHLNSREGEDLWAYRYGLSGGDMVQRNAQVWVDALFSSAENSGDLDYSADTTGVIAAVEGKPTQNLLVGAGYAYQQTDMDSGSKSSDIDTHSVFGYGEYSWRQWFVNALVSYNMSSFDQTKKAFGESISSDFDTDVLGAQLLVGQNLGSCNGETLLRIRPQAGVRYYKISQDGYKDSAGVQYGDIDSDVITGVAGVEVVVDTEINNTQVEPKAFVNATYDFQNDDATTVIKLPNGNGYTISQSANGKFGIETGVGIDVKMNDRATVGAMYQYDWRDDYSAHTGLLNVKYAF